MSTGARVYLIGAGPGDPGLLTVKGHRCLARADVVIYDDPAHPRLLAHARPGAERIYVGKTAGTAAFPQEVINNLLVERARGGKVVARLGVGDPFMAGHGGEEAEALQAAGISFEIVPGVPRAGAAAYAGIPLTHGNLTSTVAFIDGNGDQAEEAPTIAWDKIATGVGTLVFLTGISRLPEIVGKLAEHGRPLDTPAALIRRGTRPDQEVLTGTLGELAGRAGIDSLSSPAILVVGEVVALRDKLNWFETKPLFGRRIVVTRARDQAAAFAERLEEEGAEVIQFPTIAPVPLEDYAALDAALDRLRDYGWIIFTSAMGVRALWKRLRQKGRDARAFGGVQVCAIGPGTAAALEQRGVIPDLIPAEFRAEGIADAFGPTLAGVRFLLPRAAVARDYLPTELRRRGAVIDVLPAYRTERTAGDAGTIKRLLQEGRIDAITFTSSSTVANFCELLQSEDLAALLRRTTIACIGPITADEARRRGLTVDVVADQFTVSRLTEALVRHFSPQGS